MIDFSSLSLPPPLWCPQNPHDVVHSSSGTFSLPSVDPDVSALPLNGLSLEEMLERYDETAACDDFHCSYNKRRQAPPKEFGISAEDIDFFRCNKHRLQQQRQELRSKLKSQFLDMQRRLRCASPSCLPCARRDYCGRATLGGGAGECVSSREATHGHGDCEANAEEEKKKMTGVRA